MGILFALRAADAPGRAVERWRICRSCRGGIEIGWIALYQHLAGHESAAVARGVTQSLLPGLASAPAAVPLGLVIHMALAVALGIVIAVAIPRMAPRLAGTPLGPSPWSQRSSSFGQ